MTSQYPEFFEPKHLGEKLYGGASQANFDNFVNGLLKGGAMNADVKQVIALIVLIIVALNWVVVLINYEATDVQGGEFGGLVPDLIASFFRISPDGINKKAGTAKQSYLDACEGVQAGVYALAGLAAIAAIKYLMSSASINEPWYNACMIILMIGAINWVITLINMYVFDVQNGGASGYAPDLVFLLSKIAGPDTMKMSPYPGGSVDDGTVMAVKTTQQVIYGVVGIAAVFMIAQHARK